MFRISVLFERRTFSVPHFIGCVTSDEWRFVTRDSLHIDQKKTPSNWDRYTFLHYKDILLSYFIILSTFLLSPSDGLRINKGNHAVPVRWKEVLIVDRNRTHAEARETWRNKNDVKNNKRAFEQEAMLIDCQHNLHSKRASTHSFASL